MAEIKTAGFVRGRDGDWLVRVTFDGRNGPEEGETITCTRNRDNKKERVILDNKLWEGANDYDGGRKAALFRWHKAKQDNNARNQDRRRNDDDGDDGNQPPPRRPAKTGEVLWVVAWTEGGKECEKKMDRASVLKLLGELSSETLATSQVWPGKGKWVEGSTILSTPPF